MSSEFDVVEQALARVIEAAASPAVQEAQVLLLRRLALEGGVVPSRIPPAANITEVGGYLNLLAGAQLDTLRTSAIASALGVASPAAVSWDEAPPLLGMAAVTNDRSAFPAAPSLALSVPMRADFAAAWRNAVVPRLDALGAALALWAPPPRLPDATEGSSAPDPMPALGRVVWIAPETALRDPDHDHVLLGRADTDPADALHAMLRVADSAGVAPQPWNALVWDAVASVLVERALGPLPLVPLADVVALAGFEPESPLPRPTSRNDLRWRRLTNRSGLVPGVSTLGDELRLLWSTRDIARSAFAPHLDWLWNGSEFSAA